MTYTNAENTFTWHYRLVWILGVVWMFDGLYGNILTDFAFAGPVYYLQVASGVVLLVLGFLIRRKSLIASRAAIALFALNGLIGLHLSYQNAGLGIITIGNALWGFFVLWMLVSGSTALQVLRDKTYIIPEDMVTEEGQ